MPTTRISIHHEENMVTSRELSERFHILTSEYQAEKQKDALLAQEEDDINKKIAVLERERASKRKKRKKFASKFEEFATEWHAIRHVYNYQTTARWAKLLSQRLPREIRDMVYDYLTPWMERRIFDTEKPWKKENEFQRLFSNSSLKYVNLEVVGEDFMKEYIEACYRCTLWELQHPKYIRSFLAWDPLVNDPIAWNPDDVGLDVAAVITRLEVTLQCSESEKADRAALLRYLKPLIKVRCKTAIKICLDYDKSFPRGTLEVLHDIIGWIFQMKEASFELNVRTRVPKGRIEFMDCVGHNMVEFEKWRSTWPESERFWGVNKTFLNNLALEQRRESDLDWAM